MQGNYLSNIQEVVPTCAQFPLPSLGPKLKAALAEVQSGRGFFILRCAQARLVEVIVGYVGGHEGVYAHFYLF